MAGKANRKEHLSCAGVLAGADPGAAAKGEAGFIREKRGASARQELASERQQQDKCVDPRLHRRQGRSAPLSGPRPCIASCTFLRLEMEEITVNSSNMIRFFGIIFIKFSE